MIERAITGHAHAHQAPARYGLTDQRRPDCYPELYVRDTIDTYQQRAPNSENLLVSADAPKIVQSGDPSHPYLHHHSQIGHDRFEVIWSLPERSSTGNPSANIASGCYMPDIRIRSDNLGLRGLEVNLNGERLHRLTYYQTLVEFIGSPGVPTRQISLPQTDCASADGTPNFGSISANETTGDRNFLSPLRESAVADQKSIGMPDFSRFLLCSNAWLNIAFFEKFGYQNG